MTRKPKAPSNRKTEKKSEMLRGLISEHVAKVEASKTQPALKDITMTIAKNPRKSFAFTAATALSALLLTAQPSMAEDTLFDSYDKNNDGIITTDEIHIDAVYHLDSDNNNSIEPDEFHPLIEAENTTNSLKNDSQGQTQREISATYKRIDLSTPGNANITEWGIGHTLPADTPDQEIEDITTMLLEMMKQHSKGVPHDALKSAPAPKTK